MASGCTPIHPDAPHTFGHPHTFRCSPYVETPSICPQCSPVHLHVLGASACDWGMQGALLLFGTPHVFGFLPMCLTPATHLYAPLHVYVLQVICMCYGGNIPYGRVWEVSAHLSGFWCQSVHPLDVHYASSCTYLVMSQVSTSMATTTTSQATVVSSGMSSLSSVTMAPSLIGLPPMLGQHDVFLLPPLTPRCSGGVLGHASVHSSNLHLQCLIRPMPWVLHR